MSSPPQPRPRSRAILILSLGVVIALGLGSRSGRPWIPAWVAGNAGDALWTVAVYLSLAILRPATRPGALALGALGISVAVEFSQLIRVDWLEQVRRTLPGRLLLGQGFQAADLLRYAVGAALAWVLDRGLRGRGSVTR